MADDKIKGVHRVHKKGDCIFDKPNRDSYM